MNPDRLIWGGCGTLTLNPKLQTMNPDRLIWGGCGTLTLNPKLQTMNPDRLIWGGCGTLMRANVDEVMGKHTSTLKSMMSGGRP
jgi:hypothetical protein